MDDNKKNPPLRVLSDQEFNALTVDEKFAYLAAALRFIAEQRDADKQQSSDDKKR